MPSGGFNPFPKGTEASCRISIRARPRATAYAADNDLEAAVSIRARPRAGELLL